MYYIYKKNKDSRKKHSIIFVLSEPEPFSEQNSVRSNKTLIQEQIHTYTSVNWEKQKRNVIVTKFICMYVCVYMFKKWCDDEWDENNFHINQKMGTKMPAANKCCNPTFWY